MDAPLMTEDQKKAALQSNDKRFLIVSAEKLKGGDFGKTYKGQWKVKNQKLVRYRHDISRDKNTEENKTPQYNSVVPNN